MTVGQHTYIRRDVFTGPMRLARQRIPARLIRTLARRLALTGGSREHYFHFLIGYLLPLIHAQSQNRFETFNVLDCGPLMTPILEKSLRRLGYEFTVVTDDAVTEAVFVETWDRLEVPWKSPGAVHSAAEALRAAWRDTVCPTIDCAQSENLLIRRSDPHEHYTSGRAQVPGYGTSRRGITNLDEVSAVLLAAGVTHSIYEAGAHTLGCQMASFAAARRILGMRGAEWANVIFGGPVRVRMLDPSPPAQLVTGLFEQLDVRYEIAVVGAAHAAEDPAEALRFFTEP